MKITIELDDLDKITENINAVERASCTPQVGLKASVLLVDVKSILIAIKDAYEKEKNAPCRCRTCKGTGVLKAPDDIYDTCFHCKGKGTV